MISEISFGIMSIFYHLCVVISCASLVANFLPNARFLNHYPKLQALYLLLIDWIALLALNFRADLPSLDKEILGFKSRFRHAYRNWKQTRKDIITQKGLHRG
jgi:hypothetical protein